MGRSMVPNTYCHMGRIHLERMPEYKKIDRVGGKNGSQMCRVRYGPAL